MICWIGNFSNRLSKISLRKCGKPEINEPCVWSINVFVVNVILPCNKTLGCGIFYSTIMCCHLPDVATFILTCWILLKPVNTDLLFKSRTASFCRCADKTEKSQRMQKKEFLQVTALWKGTTQTVSSSVLKRLVSSQKLSQILWVQLHYSYIDAFTALISHNFYLNLGRQSLRWKVVFVGIIVNFIVIFLLFVFFIPSSLKEEQKTWQLSNRESDYYISNMYSPVFAATDLPSEKASWQLWSKTPCHRSFLIPFLTCILWEEEGRQMGSLVQVSVMCWILMRWSLCPVSGAFLKYCLQKLNLWLILAHLWAGILEYPGISLSASSCLLS